MSNSAVQIFFALAKAKCNRTNEVVLAVTQVRLTRRLAFLALRNHPEMLATFSPASQDSWYALLIFLSGGSIIFTGNKNACPTTSLAGLAFAPKLFLNKLFKNKISNGSGGGNGKV